MKITFKTHLLPHLIAIAIFFSVVSLYGLYTYEGKSLVSHDGTSYTGAAQEYFEYEDKGDQILWNSRVFSGMPMYQIAYEVKENLIKKVTLYTLFMPSTVGLMFSLMIGFYIALLLFDVQWKVAIATALGFGLSTWFLLSIEASHNTKIAAIAYVAPLLGSIYYAFRKNLFLGAALVAFFVSLNVVSNHYQITYYSLFFILLLILNEIIYHFSQKNILAFFKKAIVVLLFALLGVLPNLGQLWSTFEYADETMRGGKSELTLLKENPETGENGLDKDYAMRWSYGKKETLNLLIPGLFASGYQAGENSALVADLKSKGISKQQALNYAKGVPMYYGSQPFTSGPTYIGLVFILLFGLFLFIDKTYLRWVFLGVTILTIFFAWGENFWSWNSIFFNHFPMFSKFRAPSMWLSMAIISVALGASFGLNELVKRTFDEKLMLKKLYIVAGSLGFIVFFVWLFGASLFDFNGANDEMLAKNGFPVDAIIEDRIALLKADSFRALLLLAVSSGLIWLFIKNKLKNVQTFIIAIGLLILVDMWTVGKRYFNEDDFKKQRKNEQTIALTNADKTILNDKTYFRVFNTTVSSFNDNGSSYYHHNVGGYSAAKLYRYQDFIDALIAKGNMQAFNMLNTKYFIQGEAGKEVANQNPGALGEAWFVNEIKWAKNADEEVSIMQTFDPKNTVVIDERFKENVGAFTFSDSVSNQISLASFHPDKMVYTATAEADGYAVFSEIWYKGNKDWKATIDGKLVTFDRVNYLLRGMKIPKGNHEIVFEFKPDSHYKGKWISLVSSILILIAIAFSSFLVIRKQTA